MALKFSATSCIFRQVPVSGIKTVRPSRRMRAANDNAFRRQIVQTTQAVDSPSLADVGPIAALMAISAGTLYVITTMISGYVKSFPLLYP